MKWGELFHQDQRLSVFVKIGIFSTVREVSNTISVGIGLWARSILCNLIMNDVHCKTSQHRRFPAGRHPCTGLQHLPAAARGDGTRDGQSQLR